jgi:hypothetical protein
LTIWMPTRTRLPTRSRGVPSSAASEVGVAKDA